MQLSIVYHIFKNTTNLEASLKLLINQSDKNFELIIFDDNANTHAQEIISKLDFSPIKKYKYVSNNHNLGHALCFNMARNLASCPFIYYTGSNAVFSPDFVKEINQILKDKPQTDILSFWTNSFDSKKTNELFALKKSDNFIYQVLLHGLKNKIFRIDFLKENKLNLIPYRHLVLIFNLHVLSLFKHWEFYNKQIISFKRNKTYSYNLCDLLDESESLLDHIKTKQAENLNKEAIEYFAIRNVIYLFVTRMFTAYDDNSIRQSALVRVKSWINENLKRWYKNPILVKEDVTFDNIKIIKFIKEFNFSIKYVVKNSKDL